MFKLFRVVSTAMAYICIISFAFSDAFAGKYDHSDLSLDIPDGWVETETFYMDSIEVVFSKNADEEIKPFMMIAISDETDGRTISDLVANAIKIVASTIPDAKFLFERDVYSGKVKWREIIYQYSDAGYSFQTVQYHTIYDKKHYAFTGQSLQADFRNHLDDFRKTFNTWTFKAD